MQTTADQCGGSPRPGGSDRDLMARFLASRDEAAFAELVARHGPLVMSVAWRVLRDPHAAEDAFQATFLVLAKSARRIRKLDSLASWLHGTAFRVAHRLLRTRLRRKEQDLPSVELATLASPNSQATSKQATDEQAALDEELARLSDGLRGPLVLHYLEGRTVPEIAAELKMTPAAVEGRLKRGKQTLRKRLLKRGVLLSAALHGASLIVPGAAEAASLVQATTVACVAAASRSAIPPIVASTVTHIALQELATMTRIALMKTALVWGGVAAGVGLAGSGLGDAIGASVSAVDAGAAGLPGQRSMLVDPELLEPRLLKTSVLAQVSAAEEAKPQTAESAEKKGIVIHVPEADAEKLTPKQDTEARLQTPVNLSFQDAPMTAIVGALVEQAGFNAKIDAASLSDAHISPSIPITINVKGIKAKTVLNSMLSELGLDYRIQDDGQLVIQEKKPNVRIQGPGYRVEADGIDVRVPDDGQPSAGAKSAKPLPVANKATTSDAKAEQIDREISELDNELFKLKRDDREKASTISMLRQQLSEAGLGDQRAAVRQQRPLSPNQATMEAKLREPINLTFTGQPLNEVMQYIETETNSLIRLDMPALQEAGVAPETEINFIGSGITLEAALDMILENVVGTQLDHVFHNEAMLITTKTKADEMFETRIYDVRQIPAGATNLPQLITSAVAPQSWDESGGNGVLKPIDGGLVVRQTQRNHREITKFLEMLVKHSATNKTGNR